MRNASLRVLRVGLGITFVWIGLLILKQPEAFAGYLQPWAAGLLPISIAQAMVGTAILDIVIGILFFIARWSWIAAVLGTAHLAIVLVVSGITDITVRDIGLLAGTIAVAIDSTPSSFFDRMKQVFKG